MAVSFQATTGRTSNIGTGVIQLKNSDLQGYQGVQLLAPTGNSATVWVGFSPLMTRDSSDSLDGFPLNPGTSILLPVRSINTIYVSSPTAGQKIFWLIS